MNRQSSSARVQPSLVSKARALAQSLRVAQQDRTIAVAKPYSPHPPSRQQEAFLRLDAEEAFFGGSAGGGKTDAGLLGALQYIDVPGYSAGIFRRTEVDLLRPGAILDRARTWFAGTAARWDGDANAFRFPSYTSGPGASIHFGYAATKTEVEFRYQGTEFQFIFCDELGQWIETVYRYLFSRLRPLVGVPVPTRMRAAGNPGGRGAEWVRERFAEHARHVESGVTLRDALSARLRGEPMPWPPYFQSPPSDEALEMARKSGRRAQGAYFVPSFLDDNPGVDREAYRAQLARLTPEDRLRLEKGDWWAATGGKFFSEDWFRYCEPEEAPRKLTQVRFWDFAATKPKPGREPDYTAGVLMGAAEDDTGARRYWILDARRRREDPGGTEAFISSTASEDGRRVPVYLEEEPGSAGKNNTWNYAARVLKRFTVHGHRETGPKIVRWKALSAAMRNGLVTCVRGEWNRWFREELCALTDDDSHAHDDGADAASGCFSVLNESGETEEIDSKPPKTEPKGLAGARM